MNIASHIIKPIGTNILVKHLPKEKSGRLVLVNVHEKNFTAEVVAIGRKVDPEIKIGDHILFDRKSRNVWDLEDGEYLTVDEEDILIHFPNGNTASV